jgi:hypothetical protein
MPIASNVFFHIVWLASNLPCLCGDLYFFFFFCSTLFAFFISFLVFVAVTPQAHEGGCW